MANEEEKINDEEKTAEESIDKIGEQIICKGDLKILSENFDSFSEKDKEVIMDSINDVVESLSEEAYNKFWKSS